MHRQEIALRFGSFSNSLAHLKCGPAFALRRGEGREDQCLEACRRHAPFDGDQSSIQQSA